MINTNNTTLVLNIYNNVLKPNVFATWLSYSQPDWWGGQTMRWWDTSQQIQCWTFVKTRTKSTMCCIHLGFSTKKDSSQSPCPQWFQYPFKGANWSHVRNSSVHSAPPSSTSRKWECQGSWGDGYRGLRWLKVLKNPAESSHLVDPWDSEETEKSSPSLAFG